MKMHPVTDGQNTIGHVREDGTRFEARHFDGTTSPVFNDRTAASDWVYRHEANHPAFPKESILIRRDQQEPVLGTAGLDEAAHLIEQLYPGVWEVLPHSEEYPYDFKVVTGGGERTILEGPIGHENLARYFAEFQPAAVRAILADNQRLRKENIALRQGKTTWPES